MEDLENFDTLNYAQMDLEPLSKFVKMPVPSTQKPRKLRDVSSIKNDSKSVLQIQSKSGSDLAQDEHDEIIVTKRRSQSARKEPRVHEYPDWRWIINFKCIWMQTKYLRQNNIAIHSLWGFVLCTECRNCYLDPIQHLLKKHGRFVDLYKLKREALVLGLKPLLGQDARFRTFFYQSQVDCFSGIGVRKGGKKCKRCSQIYFQGTCCAGEFVEVECAQKILGRWISVTGKPIQQPELFLHSDVLKWNSDYDSDETVESKYLSD
jgi:hypothetical protein